jgi:hypothetical protein
MSDVSGPIDYLVLELPTANTDGSMAAAIMDLVEAGTIALLDVMVIEKAGDGSVSAIDLDLLDGELTIVAGARSGLLGDDDVDSAGDALLPGTTAAILVYENTWARPFVAAARSVGAEVVASARIPADVVNEVLDALDEG